MLSRLPFPGPVAALESLPALFPVSALHTYCSFITASLEREGMKRLSIQETEHLDRERDLSQRLQEFSKGDLSWKHVKKISTSRQMTLMESWSRLLSPGWIFTKLTLSGHLKGRRPIFMSVCVRHRYKKRSRVRMRLPLLQRQNAFI
jgi:hypothetical protein